MRAGLVLAPRTFLGTPLYYRLSGCQGYWMWTEELGHLKISKDSTGNRTRNLSSCVAVPQRIALISDYVITHSYVTSVLQFVSYFMNPVSVIQIVNYNLIWL